MQHTNTKTLILDDGEYSTEMIISLLLTAATNAKTMANLFQMAADRLGDCQKKAGGER